MAEGTNGTPTTGFQVETAALGTLSCRRMKVRDDMELAKQFGGASTPELAAVARVLLSLIATKADGSTVGPAEAEAVSEDELERFASGVLGMHEDVRSDGSDPSASAVAALAAWIRERHESMATISRLAAGTAVGSFARIKDGLSSASLAAKVMQTGVRALRASPVPDLGSMVPPSPPRPADTALDIVAERLEAFRASLPEDTEAVMVTASAPGGPCFYIQETEALSREMIALRGLDDEGGPVEVVQHHSQCNIIILPVKRPAAKGPLGFTSGARRA